MALDLALTAMQQHGTARFWATLGLVAGLAGCSASSSPANANDGTDGSVAGASSPGQAGTGPNLATGGKGGLAIDLPIAGGPTSGSGGTDSCATQSVDAQVQREPVDIVVVIDNSGSMQQEIDAVEKNINVNFANILGASGVDYRVILLSRHEKAGRDTSICVTAPLSGNTACPPTPDMPAFTPRFYHYSLKVESINSLSLLIATLDGTKPDEFKLAPNGWGEWLRPEASKVFLEITDDNSTEMTAADFVAQLVAKSPQFGTVATPRFVFHSIIGIGEKPVPAEPWLPAEPLQNSLCKGNGGRVVNPGPVYQELSRQTGGLRFPLCQFSAFDVVFETIAKDVASKAAIACDFDIPAPPSGRDLDLSKVAVSYGAGDGTAVTTFGQAMTRDACVPNAFYVDDVAKKILLCPDTCSAAQRGKNPKINVLFTCEPTFVAPPK